jgi:elongation factor G
VEVAPRPRTPGDHSLPPFEAEIDGQARSLPEDLQKETLETIASACVSGGANGYPVVDVKIRVLEIDLGEAPDPSIPLRASLALALRRAFSTAGMTLLEPVMRLELRVPDNFLGAVVRDLGARRAEIRETEIVGTSAVVRAFVPLAGMFGYSTDLRSLTQGHGSFAMEPFDYQAATTGVRS